MAYLSIQELPISTKIGVTDEERSTPQTVTVGVWLRTDSSAVEQSDDITDTLDYDNVIVLIQDLAQQERHTIEHFGAEIADAIIEQFSPENVTVHVQKQIREDGTKANVTIDRP